MLSRLTQKSQNNPRSHQRIIKVCRKIHAIIGELIDSPLSIFGVPSKYVAELNNIVNCDAVDVSDLPDNFNSHGQESITNKRAHYKANKYAIQNLLAIGGGASRLLKRCLKYRRAGGSLVDKVNYLKTYVEDKQKRVDFVTDPEVVADTLFGPNKFKVLTKPEARASVDINVSANPGFIFKELGFKDKQETYSICDRFFSIIYDEWVRGDSFSQYPIENVWTMASRPKLREGFKHLKKARKGEPIGRLISMTSPMEQLLSHPIWYPLFQTVKARANLLDSPLLLGLKRTSDDWTELGAKLESAKWIYCGDWKQFDQTVRSEVIFEALNVIGCALDLTDSKTRYYWLNLRQYMEQNLIQKHFRLDHGLYASVDCGVPSGSLWTSLIDSICNYLVIANSLSRLNKISSWDCYVYGDDHMILIYEDSPWIRSNFKRSFQRMAYHNYGLTASQEDCYLTTGKMVRVGYKMPVYKPGKHLLEGTGHLRPLSYRLSTREPSEQIKKMWRLGLSHRWYYDFRKRPSFLSYYWNEDLLPIRPTFESIVRIVNPEVNVPSPEFHENLLKSHFLDNMFNRHTLNYIYHMLYDTTFLRGLCDPVTRHIPPAYDLWNKRNLYTQVILSKNKPPKGDRAWYRRGHTNTNLDREPCMRLHNLNIQHLRRIAHMAWGSDLFDPANRGRKRLLDRLIYKGIVTLDQVYGRSTLTYRDILNMGAERAETFLNFSDKAQNSIISTDRLFDFVEQITGLSGRFLDIHRISKLFRVETMYIMDNIRI